MAADIAIRLTERKICYCISADRSSITVPRKSYDNAMQELSSYKHSLLLDFPYGNKFVSCNKIELLEKDLQACIKEIDALEKAYVKILPGSPDNMIGSSWEAIAAVMLKLKPGSALNNCDISGIIHLVSYSVEGLKPENVTLISESGSIIYNQRIYEQLCDEYNYQHVLSVEQQKKEILMKMLCRKKHRTCLI